MPTTHTNTAAARIDLQAAHYQMGVRGLHALLAALAGKVVTYRDAEGYSVTGHLTVSDVQRQEFGPVLSRTGFGFLVRLGQSSDFTACGVWQDDEGVLDLASIGGRGVTISL